jgi:ABC-type spermidine/putrescine transport system permease subunit I
MQRIDLSKRSWTLPRDIVLSAPAITAIAGGVLAPLALMFILSFVDRDGRFSGENYQVLFEPFYLTGLRTTFQVAFLVTAICALLGYPLSYYLSRLPVQFAAAALLLVLLPFWTSVLVRTYAWLVLLQRHGLVNDALLAVGLIESPLRLVNNLAGTTIGMVHVLLPYFVLPLYANMRSIPEIYWQAASTCGASPRQAFMRVYLPLTLPGLFAGLTLVFTLSLGFYITPEILGGGKLMMWANHLDFALTAYPHWGAASAIGVALLLTTLLLAALLQLIIRLSRPRKAQARGA